MDQILNNTPIRFTCSKSAIETLDKDIKYVDKEKKKYTRKIRKNTRKIPGQRHFLISVN